MKKIYTSFKSKVFIGLLSLFTLSHAAYSQCGNIVENFNNTGGSTAGFTGDFVYASSGGGGSFNGYLTKTGVLSRVEYSITSPTYKLPADATQIQFGFDLNGSIPVATINVVVLYKSTTDGSIKPASIATFIPTYSGTGSNRIAQPCQGWGFSNLPEDFSPTGTFRFVFRITTSTGNGGANDDILFDNFRTNGAASQIPLPVTFIGFEAKNANSAVQLTWKVAGEENVVRYDVEKSTDGIHFSTIGTVATTGNDTYTFTDAASNGTAFYRIKNVDRDAKFKYSSIARIANGISEILLKAFPQPVLSQLTLQHPVTSVDALIRLSTVDGRIVRTIKPSNGSMQTAVDMSSLQPGLYLLHFNGGDGNTQTLKVVKQ